MSTPLFSTAPKTKQTNSSSLSCRANEFIGLSDKARERSYGSVVTPKQPTPESLSPAQRTTSCPLPSTLSSLCPLAAPRTLMLQIIRVDLHTGEWEVQEDTASISDEGGDISGQQAHWGSLASSLSRSDENGEFVGLFGGLCSTIAGKVS